MIAELYDNKSSNNVVGKSVEKIQTVNATLKNETSIVDPIIRVQTVSGAAIIKANYLYIPDFRRYYYIQDTVAVTANVWEINCHVDVLMSFSAEIKALPAVIARQENLFNVYLNDSQYKSYQNNMVQLKAFPAGFKDRAFILMTAG